MRMRGHPLVWHERNPPWLEDTVRTRRDPRLLTGYVAAAGAALSRPHAFP